MDTMPSSEFRKRYASLTDRVAVTVNGHVIGEWIPVGAPVVAADPPVPVADEDVVDFGLSTPEVQAAAADRLARGAGGSTLLGAASHRPFRPVPKPSRR